LRGNLNPACRPEVRKQISKTRIERGVAKGKNNPMFGKTHTPEAIKKILSHRPMNKLEKIVADELDKISIPYYFQYFITDNGICKSYDFKIKQKPIILEIDGDFWHGNPNTKNHFSKVSIVKKNDTLKENMAKNRGYKVIRLWERDIKKNPSLIGKVVVGQL
jgi:G:T-mismatch repair DNA endonuclease (very short patch repair protein)